MPVRELALSRNSLSVARPWNADREEPERIAVNEMERESRGGHGGAESLYCREIAGFYDRIVRHIGKPLEQSSD